MTQPIYFSEHAKLQMQLRGAEESEVISTIRTANRQSAKQGRFRSRSQFAFDNISPMNNQFYAYKAIEVIFADNVDEIVVITVKVYYYN